jgi:hypothetical protein
MLVMILGGVYFNCEREFNKVMNKTYFLGLAIIYLFIMWIDKDSLNAHFSILSMNVNILGFFRSILGIALLIGFTKSFNYNRILDFIGKNSMLFYFKNSQTSNS